MKQRMRASVALAVAVGAFSVLSAMTASAETYYMDANSGTSRWIPGTNAYWWVAADGVTRAGADGAPLGAEDTFVVDRNRALCTANSNDASASRTFTGKQLVLGNLDRSGAERHGTISHYAGSVCHTRWSEIVMKYGSYVFENAPNVVFTIYGDLVVDGTDALKNQIYNSWGYQNQSAVWHGDWRTASPAAYLKIGVTNARVGAKEDRAFRLTVDGSTADYTGTIEVVGPDGSKSELHPDFHTTFGIAGANASFGGTLILSDWSALTTPGNTLTIANLTIADNTILEVNGADGSLSSYVVTGAFAQSGTTRIVVPDPAACVVRDGVAHRHAVLKVPFGAGLASKTFVLDTTTGGASLFSLEADDDGVNEYLYLKQVALRPTFELAAAADGVSTANPLAHADCWLDAAGNPSGASTDPLADGSTYVVNKGRTLTSPNSNDASMKVVLAGARVQLGDLLQPTVADRLGKFVHYCSQGCTIDYGSEGLHLQNCTYDFRNGPRARFQVFGDIHVENDADHKVAFFGDSRYEDQIVNWFGDLKGAPEAVLRIGPTTARSVATDKFWRFIVQGTGADFKGCVDVVTPETKTAPDFEVGFGIGGALNGEVKLGDQTALFTPTNALAVKKLTMTSKNAIEFVSDGRGNFTSVTVTEALTLPSDKLTIRIPDLDSFLMRDGYTHDYTLLKVPAGTGLSDDTVAFDLGETATRTKFDIALSSDADGEYVVLYQTVTEIERMSLTADGHNGYNLCNAYYWADAVGNRAGANGNPLPGNYEYLVDSGRILRTPNSNDPALSQTFTGFRLVIGRAGGNSQGTIWHYSGGGENGCRIDYGPNGLVLGYAEYQFNNGHRCHFFVDGDIIVDNDAAHPARIYNSWSLKDQTVFWTGNLSGADTSRLLLGYQQARTVENDSGFTFHLIGDAYDFMGTMEIVAPTPTALAPDFRTGYSQAGQFGGTLKVGSYSTLSAPTATLEVARLELANKSRLEILGDGEAHSQFVINESLTVDGVVEIALTDAGDMLDVSGAAPAAKTILLAPLGTGLDEANFTLVGDEATKFYRLTVDSDSVFEYLQLEQVPVVTLVAADVMGKDHSVGGVVPPSAFETKASWSDGELPHPGANYYIRDLDDGTFARTPQADYEFPGDTLTIGKRAVLLQCCKNLTVDEMALLDGGVWHVEQAVEGPYKLAGTTFDCPSGTAYVSPYNAKEVQIASTELTGAAKIVLGGVWGGTSRPDGSLTILSSTADFTGTFAFGRYELKSGTKASEVNYAGIFYVRNDCFAAPLDAFDWKALEIGCYTELRPRGDVPTTLAGDLNRGLYINARTIFNCDNTKYGTFAIDFPLTVNHGFSKTGPGTLAFGGAAAGFVDESGARVETPTVGKSEFAISNGVVQVTGVDALNGVAMTLAGGRLESAIDASDATHLRYGLRNTKTATPFALDGLAKLPLDVSLRNADDLPVGSFAVGYLTVSAAAADVVRAMLPPVAAPAVRGCRIVPVELTDSDTGDVTFGFTYTRRATVLLIK